MSVSGSGKTDRAHSMSVAIDSPVLSKSSQSIAAGSQINWLMFTRRSGLFFLESRRQSVAARPRTNSFDLIHDTAVHEDD